MPWETRGNPNEVWRPLTSVLESDEFLGVSPTDDYIPQWNAGLSKFDFVASTSLGYQTHAALPGLTTGDAGHTQFAMLAGRSGGQSLIGDTATGGHLRLQSTVHATKGRVKFGTGELSYYDETLDKQVANLLKVGSLSGILKATSGEVGTAVAGSDYEVGFGNPAGNGYVLSSTTGGVRSWVNPATLVTDLSTTVILLPTADARNVIQPSADTVIPLTVKGFSPTQSDLLFRAVTSADEALFSIDPSGHAFVRRELRFGELIGGGSNYIGLKAPDSLAGDVTWTLPSNTPTNGQLLAWTAGNLLSWITLSHGATSNLGVDDHSQYLLLAGRSGGQVARGGTAASETLTLMSTIHTTKGKILFGTSAYDEVNNRLGIGTASPAQTLDVNGTAKIGTLSGMIKGTTGVLSVGVSGTDYEAGYGNPAADGYILTSTAAGVRSWQAPATVSTDLTGAVILLPTTDARNVVQPNADTVIPLTVKGFSATHSDLLFRAVTSADGVLFSVDPSGHAYVRRELRFGELIANGANYIGLKAPDSLAGDVTWTLPSNTPTNGQILAWTTGNLLSWITLSHGALSNLSVDDHNIYFLLAGRSGGQTARGGTGASETLTLSSTINATKGKILFGTSGYDEVNNRLGLGTASPAQTLDVNGTAKIGTLSGMIKGTTGVLSVGVSGTDYEAGYGNPAGNGYVLSSTTGGVRSWVNPATLVADLSGAVILLPTTDARNIVQPNADTIIPLTVKGFSPTHSDLLFRALTSADGVLFSVDPSGHTYVRRELRFGETIANGASYISLRAPDSLASNVNYILPSDTPTNGQVLAWNTGDQLSWETPIDGSGTAATMPVWVDGNTLGNSPLTVSGGAIFSEGRVILHDPGVVPDTGYWGSIAITRSHFDPTPYQFINLIHENTRAWSIGIDSNHNFAIGLSNADDTLWAPMFTYDFEGRVLFGRSGYPVVGLVAEFASNPASPGALRLPIFANQTERDSVSTPGSAYLAYYAPASSIIFHDGSQWRTLGTTVTGTNDHGQLLNLNLDHHAGYFWLDGRACCQTAAGGALAGGDLVLTSTFHSVKGGIFMGSSIYDELNHRLGLRTWEPTHTLHVIGDIRFQNYVNGFLKVNATGALEVDTTGGSGPWTESGGTVYPTSTGNGMVLGSNARDASAILHLISTSRGFIPPVMTSGQRDVISSPAQALIQFNDTDDRLEIRINSAWYYFNVTAVGGGGGGPSTLASDDFTNPFGTTTGGQTWTTLCGTFVTEAGLLKVTGFPALATIASADADVSIEAVFTTQVTGQAIAFRVQDSTHFWYLRRSTTTYQLMLVNGQNFPSGTQGSGQVSGSATAANGDTVKVTCSGSSIQVFINGSGTPDISHTSSTFASSTAHGICLENLGGVGAVRWDNFRIYSS